MSNGQQSGMALNNSIRAALDVSEQSLDDVFWEQDNVEEQLRHRLSRYAGELRVVEKLRRQNESDS